jgi:hypothetical protein
LNIVWNNQIVLLGLDQNLQNIQHSPGTTIQLNLYWQILQPVTQNYNILLQLFDNQDNPVAFFDYQLFDGGRSWPDLIPQQTIRDTRMIILPSDLPAGRYTLGIGLYRVDTLEQLPINDAQEPILRLAEWEF